MAGEVGKQGDRARRDPGARSHMHGGDEVSRYGHWTNDAGGARQIANSLAAAEALDAPFLLLPFRPNSDPQAARTFIRNFYKSNAEGASQYQGDALKQELRLTDSEVLCSIIKWCWSRMPNGVVTWPVYEGFQIGEREANMARNAFNTFIPIGADSEARRSIIFDFFDLMASVAAHGKLNGLGGRKLSRLAGWWAFEHSDDGNGFEGGYKSWTAAANASSHLFFAYLRSLSPDTAPSMNVIERIPRSLQALVASTEYPPETPTLLQRSTARVVMLVDTVSPTPFALLRRAKNFEYRDRDEVLREFAEFEDPIDALTEECKRVLYAISSTNQSMAAASRQGLPGLSKPDESWSSFQNIGFGDIDEKALSKKAASGINGSTKTVGSGLRSEPQSRGVDGGRPTTPSWADFLSSGFVDDDTAKSPALLYPPAQILPPLGSRSSSPGRMDGIDENLAPGELAAITNVELDDAFWWVWMTSLAGEEPSERKSVFGRCALIETSIKNGRWLIMEEQVKGASPDPAEGAFIAPKKNLFSSFTKRGRLSRKRSTSKSYDTTVSSALSATPSKTSISTDKHAKIKAAARALTSRDSPDAEMGRRGRHDDANGTKTNSVLTIGLQGEAGPAMQWAKAYDKHAIRSQYLGDAFAGKGMSRETLVRQASSNTINAERRSVAPAASPQSTVTTLPQPESAEQDTPPLPAKDTAPIEKPTAPAVDEAIIMPASAEIPQPQVEQAAAQSAFDKEVSVAPVSPTLKKVERKPVPRHDDHPAFRTQESEVAPSTPTKSPAFLAAQKALQTPASPTTPDCDRGATNVKKNTGSNAGFRKFFGMKKESSGRGDSLDLQRPAANGLAPPAEQSQQGIGRRFSQMRKKNAPPSTAPKTASSSAAVAAARAAAREPVMKASAAHPDYEPTEASRTSSREHADAEREFSRFDQGPMDDMPSAAPVDSPKPDHGGFNTITAQRLAPTPEPVAEHDHFIAPPEFAPTPRGSPMMEQDGVSEVTVEEPEDPKNVRDRWAAIRENAQKRAARASEDHDTQSRLSQSQRTDDGETSGEESEF